MLLTKNGRKNDGTDKKEREKEGKKERKMRGYG